MDRFEVALAFEQEVLDGDAEGARNDRRDVAVGDDDRRRGGGVVGGLRERIAELRLLVLQIGRVLELFLDHGLPLLGLDLGEPSREQPSLLGGRSFLAVDAR